MSDKLAKQIVDAVWNCHAQYADGTVWLDSLQATIYVKKLLAESSTQQAPEPREWVHGLHGEIEPAAQQAEAGAAELSKGTYECDVCGSGVPHSHSDEAVEIERLVRPAFEETTVPRSAFYRPQRGATVPYSDGNTQALWQHFVSGWFNAKAHQNVLLNIKELRNVCSRATVQNACVMARPDVLKILMGPHKLNASCARCGSQISGDCCCLDCVDAFAKSKVAAAEQTSLASQAKLIRKAAEDRLAEALWWEHLAGGYHTEVTDEGEPCLYCEHIDELKQTVEAALAAEKAEPKA